MNFLAHCALASDAATAWQCDKTDREYLLAGAVIGDFIKGQVPTSWPLGLRVGTQLHRKVDAISNRDPSIRQTCERFPPALRRYAPIFVDLLADYYLTNRWQLHYRQSISDFATSCYTALGEHSQYVPEEGRRFVDYMIETDLLTRYAQRQTLLDGVSSVTRRLNARNRSKRTTTRGNKGQDHGYSNHKILSTSSIQAACLEVLEPAEAEFESYYQSIKAGITAWNGFEFIAAQQNS